jgi:hypothetical protein
MKHLIRKVKSIYRKYWDFPHNWKPYGWKHYEMTYHYWAGY